MFREEQMQHNEMSLIINEDVSIRLIRFIRVQRKAEVFFLFVRGLLCLLNKHRISFCTDEILQSHYMTTQWAAKYV